MKSNAHKVLIYCSIVILTITSAFSQEICTNGMDDDGDGFIDCFDGDCAGGLSCADFFYGNPIVCRDEPTDNPTFQMRLQWGSADRTSDSHATPAVGDMDNDGIPEVVAINRLDETMFILDGQNGATKFTVDVGYRPENGIALANLDGGDCAYVFISEDNGRTISAYDCEANLVWEEDASDRVGIMGIADFDGDGNAEIYYKTEIMDAATGNIVVPGTSDNWVQNYAHSAIAVDILDDSFCPDCSGLELITGNEIWAINIGAGTRTLAKDLNDLFAAEVPVNSRRYFTKYFNTSQNRTAISVADYNLDGHVDVLMPGAYGTSNSSQTTIFFWDVFNDAYLVYDGGVNHSKGTGRLNVSDIDGDGQMNTTYVSDEILYALDENLGVLWTKGIDEGSSGFTGTTVFDFDGDGAAETIYRSENYLYIIDGTNGDTRTTVPCVSRTQEEYPLVADVDNDGSSELCVPCYTSDNTPFGPYNNTRFSQIRIYEADAGEIWQPSRRVWNQHGYFVVNVNDDLTIPAQQQDHTAIFGTENCETGAPEDVRALNGFLNQSTFLEADGCPSYVSPDVNMAGNINATPAVCPSTTFQVSFDIENSGDTDIFGTLPVTFYSGDPETPGATKLNTETVLINNFLEGETRTIDMTVEGPGGDFELYIVINNSGQDPPITLSGGGFPECDFGNNIGNTSVTYTPFDLTVNKLEDNRRCDLTKPNNGEAEAYFEGTLGGQYESIWVEDFTGLDNGDRSDTGPTAWTSARGSVNPRYWGVNVQDGNKLYRTRNTGNNNEVGGVEWLSEVIDISGHTDVDVTLELITNNRLEASGGARDVMRVFYILDGAPEVQFDTNGEMFGSFMYAIAEQQDLNGSTLQIRVTFHTTGNGEFQYLDNVRVSGESLPVVQQFTDADGWEFYWYNAGDFSTILNSGSLYTGMATGNYDVVGFFPGGNCFSDTVNIVINDSVPSFDVHIYEVSPHTDCANPDGALSAFVYTQVDGSGDPLDTITNGYTFEWLRTTELITPVATGPDLTNITSEGYTVRVEQIITGCTSSAASSVSSLAVAPPDPTAVPTDISACTGAGSTGSASASVGGITAGYDFEWFYENVDASPDYTGSVVTGLLQGTYFVRAIDTGSSCESNLITFDIDDTSADPDPVATEVQPDDNCTTNNGIATTDGDGAGTIIGFTFEWFVGSNTLPANQLPAALAGSSISADGATASGLDDGIYTVKAIRSGCESTTTVTITDAEVVPTIDPVTPTANTSCDPLNPDGGIDLSGLMNPAVGNYEYSLYFGTNTTNLDQTNATGIFTSLADTTYTIVVENLDTDCETAPTTVVVPATPNDPIISAMVVDDAGCTIGSGEISITTTSTFVEPSSYTYEIYTDASFTTLDRSETVADGAVGFTFSGLSTGTYRVNVINDDDQCSVFSDIFVDDISVDPVWNHPSTIENPNSVCVGSPNGFASVAPVGSLADFTFVWYTGDLVDPGQLMAGENQEFIDELTNGRYTVVATNINTGCETVPKTVTINLEPVLPNIVMVEVQPQNSCDVGDGILRAYVDEPDPSDCVECVEEDDYTFQWFLGNDTSTPLIEATDPGNNSNPTHVDSSRVEGLSGAFDYTVLVTNTITGCTNEATINLTYDPLPPEIDAANSQVTANTLCGPVGNGSVVAAVNFVGETINGAINDRTWDIITDCNTITDLNSSILPDGSIELTPDVNNQAGKAYLGDSVDFSTPTRIDYWMYLGDKDGSGADGITFIFHRDPAGRDALGRYGCNLGIGDESCFGGSETAISPSIAVEFDTWNNGGATKDPAWDHMAFVLNGDMSEPQGDVGVFYNANQPRIVDGQDDVETDTELRVTITIVPNLDGTQTFSVYVEDELRMQRTQDFINDIFGGNPLTIGGFTASTGGARNQQYVRLDPYFGEYDFDWYTGGSVDPLQEIAGADRPFLCDLLGGDYTLVVTYGGTGCTSSPPNTFTIPNDTDTATVSFSGTSNTVCDPALAIGGTYTGSLSADIIQDPADYVFAWFEGSAPTTDTLATTQAITDIPGGDYTVVVESLAGGCVTIRDTTLVDVTVDPAIVDINADVTVTNVTSCEGAGDYPNGSITVNTVGIGTGPFGFWYYYGSDTTTGTFLTDGVDIFTQTSTAGTASVNVSGNGSATLNGLSVGDYTIIVLDSASGCTSVAANVAVIDVPTIPSLNQNVTDNSVCDPALAASGVYDGEVEIVTTDGSDAVADYSYDWYDGTGVTTPTSWTVTDNILSQAPDGNYTVVATSNITGCDTTIYATIGDITTDPSITTTSVTNVTACEGGGTYPNGNISVDAVAGTGPFGYLYWFGSDTTTGTFLSDGSDIFTQTSTAGTASVNVSGNGTSSLSGLSAGDYTIIVIDSASGCTSVEANVSIIDIPTIPSLTQTITNNTVCDITVNNSGVYSGEVEITATDATDETTDYTYVWYDGTGTGTPTVYNDNLNVLSEAPDGNYTVVATSLITGCDTTIFATIGDATVDPVLGTIDVTPMSVCDGSAIYPNGTIDIDELAVTNGTGDYSYEFYWGSTVNPARLLADGDNIVEEKTGTASGVDISIIDDVIANLDTGFYTVVLTDNVTGCPSSEVTVEVESILVDINITVASAIVHWTNCPNPNGAISVTASMASPPEPTGGYSYRWYFGSGTTDVLDASDFSNGGNPVGVNTANVSGLEDGTYTVEVTNNDTECTELAEFEVEDQRVFPVIDPAAIVVADNINCSGPGTGSIDPTGAVTPATGIYLFTLYDPADVVLDTEDMTGGADDGIFENLSAGNYKIGVELIGTGCESVSTVAVTVENDLTAPNVNHTIVSQETSCTAPNGQISISSPGGVTPTGGWDINLFQGSGSGGVLQENIASGVSAGFPLTSAANLNDGLYTIQIINNQTGCDSLKEITILEVPDTPTINTAVRTNDNFCVGENGTISITSVTNDGATPTYSIYTGSSVTGAPDSTSTDNIFENLPPGTFTVTVTKGESGCESLGVTRTITEVPIAFTPGSTVFSDQSSCLISDPNGELVGSIIAQGTGPSTDVADYDFEWYQGQNTNPANRITSGGIIPTAVVSGTSDSRVAGLPTGTYRLRVIDPTSGCSYTVDATIDLVTTVPDILGGGPVVTDADQCAPSNGEIEVTVDDGGSTQPFDGAGGYTFAIYDGTISPMETPLESQSVTLVTGARDEATYTFTDLQPGDYTIEVTDNNTSCLVTSTIQTVNYVGTTLAFDEMNMLNSPLSACFNQNGILDIGTSLTIPGNTDDVTITWYVGTDTSDVSNIIATAIPTATISNTTNYNGLGYDIIGGRVEDLPAVSYTGVAELSNGCKFILETNLSIVEAPDVVLTIPSPNTRCDATYDGEINIAITPIPNPNPPFNDNFADDYDYYVFPGILTVADATPGTSPWTPDVSTYNGGVTAGNDGDGNGLGTFPNTGANTVSDVTVGELESGDYTVVIVINTAFGCVTNVQTVTIDPPTEPTVTLDTKSDNTVCDIGAPLNLDYNGSITVDAEHPDFVGSTFTFEWYYDIDGDGDFTVGQTAVANGADGAGTGSFVTGATTTNTLSATLDGVGPGWYRVIATHTDENNAFVDATACADTFDIEVFDDFVELAIQPAAIVTQTNVLDCGGGPEEFGEFEILTIREDGVDLAATTIGANFDITWEYDNGTGFAAYGPSIDQNHSDDLEAGDYRLNIVSRTTACDISYEFTIEDETEDPVINLLSLTDNTICVGGPLGLEADGQIVIEIQDESAVVQDPVNYDVTWYLGSIGVGNDIPANQVAGADFTTTAVDITVDDLPGGTYWVEVIKNNGDDENCTAIASFVVDDDPAVVSIQKVLGTDFTRQQQTDCSPVNGALALLNVYEDGVANAVAGGDYLFNWYDNDMTTPISVGSVGGAFNQLVSDLPFGTYFVEAENQLTDCVSPLVSFTISDERVIPNVQVAQVLPDTTCVGSTIPSGEVLASVILPGGGTAPTADYSFTWYEGTSVDPNFELDNVTPGGSVTVTGYTIGGTSESEVEGLTAGQYLVAVEDNTTPGNGCTATAVITVSRFTPVISIATADITVVDDTDCSGDNGSATVNAITVTRFGGGTYRVLPADFGDWDFEWFDDPTAGASLSTTNVLSNEGAGTYYIALSNTQSGCAIATRKAVTIQEDTSLPIVQVVSNTPDAYCATVTPNEGDGAITIKIVHEGNDPANAAQYGIEWFRGTGTATTLASAVGSAVSADSLTLTGLSAGTYTVRVIDELTPNLGCAAIQTFTINRDPAIYSLPQSALTLQDNLNCSNPNGFIVIDGVNIDGAFEDFSTTGDTYTINWPSLPGSAVQGTINQTNDQVTNLPGGTYTVDIQNDRTGCTVSADITIDDDTSDPLIQLVAKSPDTYCATVTPFEGDGWLNIRIVHEGNNPADSANYTFTWYRGTGTGTTLLSTLGTAVISPNGTGVSGLSAGTYTVNVSKNGAPNDACNRTQTFTIDRDAPTVALPASAITVQDNQNCDNPNGTITIDGIVLDGVFEDFSTTGDNYTINWTGLPGGAILNTINFTDDQVTAIEGGVYSVDISNDRTGCAVNADIIVDDVLSNPLIQLVIKNADEYCDNTGFVGNGSLEMRIVHEGNNPADSTLYTVDWYRGTGTGTPLAGGALGSAVISPNGTGLNGLSTGTYTVVVTKNGTPNDGCMATTTFTIEKDEPAFSIQTSSVQISDNINCTNPNGTIEITNVVVDGVAQSMVAFGADYAFTWPGGVGGGNLVSTNGSSNNRATDLPAGTYTIVASNVATGCSTDTISVVIQDNPTTPLLSFNLDAENTNCGPTKNGQLTVTASTSDGNPFTNVGRYTFSWFDGEGISTPTSYVQSDGVGANDNQSTLLALDSGFYTVTVFDNVNECSITGTYAVSETLDQPQLLLSEIVVRPDSTCDAGSSGTIIVADSSFATGVLDDFDVEIRSGSVTGAIVAVSAAGSGNTDLSISSLDPGSFFVLATRASSECVAPPIRVNILDERFPPTILLDTIVPNPNCGGTVTAGSIGITANGFDETNPDYLFQWYVGTIAGGVIVPGANGGNTATISNVAEGPYEVQVTNTNTGCITEQAFDLPAAPVNPRISAFSVSNNLICSLPGNGSFAVNELTDDGVVLDASVPADSINIATNFTMEFYSNSTLTAVVVDLDPSTPFILEGLSAGIYYGRARRNDSQCTSDVTQFEIQDNPQFPLIDLLQIEADSSCNGMNPNGTLRALINGIPDNAEYAYNWYEVDATNARISGVLSNNDTVATLAAGRYELEVTGVISGCVLSDFVEVISAPIDVVITGITPTDPTACTPPDGQIEVNSITPGLLGDYDFTFYFGDPGSGGTQVQTGLGPVYTGAAAGTYFIEATHLVYGCTNILNEVTLEDNQTYPDIALLSFTNQTNCDPGNPNGELSAAADGSTNTTDYTFEWRDSTNAVVAANSPTITNIAAGAYTINVTNNTTGCVSTNEFEIVNDFPLPLELVISTSPNKNCVDPNGEASATVRNLALLGNPITDYVFYWFVGDQTSGTPDIANPDFQGTLWTQLPGGDYTVYVVDATDVFCTSEPTLVVIPDETLPPPFAVEVTNDVTICYEDMRDGRARIDVNSLEPNRDLFEFRYEWYQGAATDTAGQVPFVTGIRADSLDIGTYSVLSTDLRTGCTNLVSFDIIDDTDAVPAPDVIVISDRDNCAFANGNARASISGEINDYLFEWFLATGDTTTVQFTGHEVFTLDSISYTVQATRISTGCISPKTPVEIINAIEDPVYEIEATTTMCLRTEDGAFNQFTGEAIIRFSEFIPIKEIEWIAPDGSVFSNDIKLVNAQPGLWSVRFIADNDCEYDDTFRIETELKIYNGVSANGDGRNDFFFIDCIDYFPNNTVQIFNRDGTRVWESEAYDNVNVRFEGFSNVGVGGLQLPAGTYFYIIEKGPQADLDDGQDVFEDPTIRPRLQGYLELVR